MIHRRLLSSIVAAGLAICSAGLAAADDGDGRDGLVLIRDDLASEAIRLVQLDDVSLVQLDRTDVHRRIDLDRCIALFDDASKHRVNANGVLILADGQRLPGRAANVPAADDVVAWAHAWLGRLAVPLEAVRSVQLTSGRPSIEPGDADVVLLANGDRLEGFVLSIGDVISLEVSGPGGPQVVDVPLERTVAAAMVTPMRDAAERRVWFRDGTVINVSSLRVGDDGFVRLSSPWVGTEMLGERLRLEEISAVLFSPGVMTPLARLDPSRVDGPESRYVVPAPWRLDHDAPLGLSSVEYRGPLVVRYALPSGARRFAAAAHLPAESQDWGDYELIVRDDDRIVFRAGLNGRSPSVSINVVLSGTELTIELTEGRHGPIQDRLVLERGMVLH